MKHSTALASSLLAITACANAATDALGTIDQRFLFEVEYVNHAWGLAWSGIVIDSEGDIRAYDHSHALWEPASSDSFSEAELTDKYQHELRYLGRINESTIAEMFGRLTRLTVDLSTAEHLCADAGSLSYRAFRYEPASGFYRPLLLRQEGDIVQEDRSNAGEQLAAWLRSVVLALDDTDVTPFAEGVCTP